MLFTQSIAMVKLTSSVKLANSNIFERQCSPTKGEVGTDTSAQGSALESLLGDVRVRVRVSSEVRTDLRSLKRASREPSRARGRVRANLVLSAPAPTSGN